MRPTDDICFFSVENLRVSAFMTFGRQPRFVVAFGNLGRGWDWCIDRSLVGVVPVSSRRVVTLVDVDIESSV